MVQFMTLTVQYFQRASRWCWNDPHSNILAVDDSDSSPVLLSLGVWCSALMSMTMEKSAGAASLLCTSSEFVEPKSPSAVRKIRRLSLMTS